MGLCLPMQHRMPRWDFVMHYLIPWLDLPMQHLMPRWAFLSWFATTKLCSLSKAFTGMQAPS